MRIAICTPNVERNDAVGNDVLGMHRSLCEERLDCQVFAAKSFVDDVPVKRVDDIMDYLREPHDILIYHHSVGWDFGLNILSNVECRKVVKYHNITPSRFFKDIAENYFIACEAGRSHLAEIARLNIDLFMADSTYNLQEILNMASCRIEGEVVPPFHKIDHLQDIEAAPHIISRFKDGKDNFLMVGRIVPNKGFEFLIDVFNVYCQSYNSQSRLLIVGKLNESLDLYFKALQSKILKCGLSDSVVFAGEVSAEELKAYYQIAGAFAITSMHEGFCVPLVEAMSMKVPIVAFASSAIPETVGGVGFVWEEDDPELIAASLNMIMTDDVVKRSLEEMGKRRYDAVFDNIKIKARFISALDRAGLLRK